MQFASILRRYLTLFFRQEGRRAALAFVGMSFSGLLSGVSILAILPLLHLLGVDGNRGDAGGEHGTRATSEGFSDIHALMTETPLADSLGLMLTAFVAFCTVQALLLRSINLLIADVERSFTRTLEKRLYAAIMQCDWMFFLRNRNSDLTFALTQNVQRVSSGTISFLRLISSAMIAIVHVSLCVIISPLISVGLLSCFGGFTLAGQRYNRGIKHRGTEMVGLKKTMYGTVTDYPAGMKEARSACSEQQQIESFSEPSPSPSRPLQEPSPSPTPPLSNSPSMKSSISFSPRLLTRWRLSVQRATPSFVPTVSIDSAPSFFSAMGILPKPIVATTI